MDSQKKAAPTGAVPNFLLTRKLTQTDGSPHWLRHSFIMSLLMGASSPMPLWKSFCLGSSQARPWLLRTLTAPVACVVAADNAKAKAIGRRRWCRGH